MKRAHELAPPRGTELRKVQWQDGVVLLCSKCSGQQHDADGPDTPPSWDTWKLRCWLKKELQARKLWPRVRVLTTSCMGICHDGFVTCALGADGAGAGQASCVTVDPARDAEQLLAWILASVEADPPPPGAG